MTDRELADPIADSSIVDSGSGVADPRLRNRSGDVAGDAIAAPDPDSAAAALDALRAALAALEGAAWHKRDDILRPPLAAALRALARSGCGCCGRPWSTRVVAARLDPYRGGRNYYRGRHPIAHSTIGRLARDSRDTYDRVDLHVATHVAAELVKREW